MSIHSRTALLLQKELYKLENSNSNPWGISIDLFRNNLFHWVCNIEGPPDTPWEGGQFVVEMLFGEDFNEMPPSMFFSTVPFHPNVDIFTGRICVDFLDDASQWNPGYSLIMMLCQIQNMLAHPVVRNPINIQAAEMYCNSPRLYDQIARDSVVASRRIVAGLPPFEEMVSSSHKLAPNAATGAPTRKSKFTIKPVLNPTETIKQLIPEEEDPVLKTEKITFTSYYETWKNFATSVPTDRANCLPKSIGKPTGLIAFGRRSYNNTQMLEVAQRQHRLWFGKLKPKPKEETAPLPETPAINAFSKPHSANPPFFNNNNNSSNNNSNQLLLLPQEQLQLQHSNATVEIVGAVNIIATSSSNVTSAVVEKMAEDTGVGSGSKLLDTLPGGGSKGKVNWEDDADELVDWATKQLNFEQIKVLA